MDTLKKILFLLIAGIYLFLSTGVILLKTHCECSDSTRISLYADTESCNEEIPEHDCCKEENECNDCSSEHKHHSCGCEEPIVTYLKLTNHLSEDSELDTSFSKQLNLIYFREASKYLTIVFSSESTIYPDYSPPENHLYGRNLVTFLNQQKIALTA